jgi:hypothetical protein
VDNKKVDNNQLKGFLQIATGRELKGFVVVAISDEKITTFVEGGGLDLARGLKCLADTMEAKSPKVLRMADLMRELDL